MSNHDGRVRVGVLSFHNSKETKALCNAVSALGHEPVWLREANTEVRVDGDGAAVEPDVDVVVNRLLLSNGDRPLEDLEIANVLAGIRPIVNRPPPVLTALHKYAAAVHLSENGVPVPAAHMGLTGPQLESARGRFDGDVVQKTGVGTHGESVEKLGDGPAAPSVGRNRTFLQRYVDQEDAQSDVRVYVVGGTAIGAMRRVAPDDDWRANIARGARATDASEEACERAGTVAKDAADALGLDVAGVDLMECDGGWVVIEVNPTAGFRGFFDATGRNPAPRIVELAVERAGGEVDADRLDELASSLDDSVPDCRPDRESASTQPTIGLTEDVVVNGDESTASVTAKADSGAKRTSIGIELAGDVGAGPIRSSTNVKSGSQKSSKRRPLVDIEVAVRDRWREVTASVEDREHMQHQLILGRDLLTEFRLDISTESAESVEGEE